jgi:hypothetical protein
VRSLIVLLILSSGCAELMYRYDQTVATSALGAMACRDALSEGNGVKIAACGEVLKTGDRVAAQKCLDDWKGLYSKIETACKAWKDGTKSAVSARPLVEAAANKKKEVFGWIARLVKFGLDIAAIFTDAGLKFTPPGGT